MDALSQTNVMDFSAALAADLAAEIYDRDTIFVNHGLSPVAGEELLKAPWFSAMVEQARRDWGALDNVRDRIRIKAQITLEEALPTVYALINDKTAPAAARVAAFKEVKEVAGMSAKENEAAPGFIPVQIFLGEGRPPITIGPSYTARNVEPIETLEEEIEEADISEEVEVSSISEDVPKPDLHPDLEPSFELGMLREDHF
jgi:hypothetical protein